MKRELAIGFLTAVLAASPTAFAYAAGNGSAGGSPRAEEVRHNTDRFGQDPISDNGGDNGWGNCGHNSSAGNPHTGTNGAGGGNGGHEKGEECREPVPDDPSPTPTPPPDILIG